MSAKKRNLELDLCKPPENEQEAVYAKGARRLEIQTTEGQDHPEFSHESGVVKLDKESLIDYQKQVEREHLVKKAKARLKIERARQALLQEQKEEEKKQEGDREFAQKMSIAKVGLRLVYAGILLYCGISGIWRMISLAMHPPARGVNWSPGIAFLIILFIISTLWKVRTLLVKAKSDPEHWLLKSFPNIENKSNLRTGLYLVEGLMLTLTIFTLLAYFTSINVYLLAPQYFFLMLTYFTLAYMACRKLITDSMGEP